MFIDKQRAQLSTTHDEESNPPQLRWGGVECPENAPQLHRGGELGPPKGPDITAKESSTSPEGAFKPLR
jgi:hypothetical protein